MKIALGGERHKTEKNSDKRANFYHNKTAENARQSD